jgi:hypothetical protein
MYGITLTAAASSTVPENHTAVQEHVCISLLLLSQGAVPALQTCPDEDAFKEDLHQYFTDIQKEQAWVETNGAEAMSAVLELVRRHKVRLPGPMARLACLQAFMLKG